MVLSNHMDARSCKALMFIEKITIKLLMLLNCIDSIAHGDAEEYIVFVHGKFYSDILIVLIVSLSSVPINDHFSHIVDFHKKTCLLYHTLCYKIFYKLDTNL
jgi:hypothetical protein